MIGTTITIVRAVAGDTVDRYGAPVAGAPLEIDIGGVAVAPRSSSDTTGPGRAGTIVGLSIYLPAGSDIRRGDQVRIAGDLFDIDGEPGAWTNPHTGVAAGIEVALRRVAG